MIQQQANSLEGVFAGGGQMGALMRCFDWANTYLGSVENWPQSLRTAVSILLNSCSPSVIYWGTEFIKFYNDAYIPILAEKHPHALGQTITQVWPELWLAIKSKLERVIDTGEPAVSEDMQLFINHSGYLEEVYMTFSYSPIRNESGNVGGIFVNCTNRTQTVIGQRRLKTIRDLAARSSDAATLRDACRLVMENLASNPTDIPFALLYLIEPGNKAHLVEKVGCIAVNTTKIKVIDLSSDLIWYFAEVIETGQPVVIDNLANRCDCLRTGSWAEPTQTALVLPIAQPGKKQPVGILVVGVNNRRALDEDYRAFFELVATEIKNAIANARVCEEERKRTETLAELDSANLKLAQLCQETTEYERRLRVVSEAARDRLHTILESITDGFIALDKDWQIVYVNQKVARNNGQTATEIVGKNFWEQWPWSVGTQVEQEYHRAVTEQVAVHFEILYEPLNVWLEIHAYPSEDGLNIFFRDITQRKQLEQDLQASETRLNDILNSAGASIGSYRFYPDRHREIDYQSAGYETVFGYTPAELTPEIWASRIPPEDLEAISSQAFAAIFAGKTVTIEYRFYHKDGSLRWVAETITSRWNEAEGYWIVTIVGFDITARKQAEEALRQSETHLAMAQRVAQVGSWEFDLNSQKISWSETTFQHWGFDPSQGEPSYTELLERVIPEDREILFQAVELAIAQKVPYTFDLRIVRPDGSIRYLDSRGEPVVNERGQVMKLIGTSLDVTDRRHTEEALRESEQFLRSIYEGIEAAVFIVDVLEDGGFRYVGINPAHERISGLESSALSGKTPEQVLIPEMAQAVTQRYRQCIEAGKRISYEECLVLEGKKTWWITNLTPLRDSNSRIYRLIGTCFNINDRKQAELELQQAKEAAETASRIKDEFLAVLSHELRSPLNPILAWAQLLRSRKFDQATTDRALETIERNAKLQTQLIEDLLDVSRIIQGKLSLHFKPVNLVAVIENALEEIRLAAQAKAIQIQTFLDSAPNQVEGDSNRLQQVVWNLLSNAVKFTPEGGQVTVKLEYCDCYAQIQVSDTGKGISPEFLPHVFKRFSQESSSTSREFGGLGLGLAIVHYLTKLHRGCVQAESQGEQLGATFTIRLPLIVSK
ncbi:MAG: PAS domain S-box protein [Fischerella sp.]|jgi:PAS domain S-box-containing protein|uniref:PAS domain S-box protein n=1 Tax=Fischerella sp. TaxID=1191 RepID=UPI0017A28A61|nr:PAS domain S-box protein [Fischerella sp.]NWF62413.1 PAS domain S-box protein [Fischerella sp.]